jgi:chromosome segregation ATPase
MESVLIADIRPLMAMRHRVVTGHQSHVIRVAIGHVTYRANASRYDTAGEWRREMKRYRQQEFSPDVTLPMLKSENGDWVRYEDAAARIAELEQQLAAAQERNVALQSEHLNHVNALHEQLTAMTAERDSESRWAKHYRDKVTELEQQLATMQRIIDSYLDSFRRII